MVRFIRRRISIFRRLYAAYSHRINPRAAEDKRKRVRADAPTGMIRTRARHNPARADPSSHF